MRYIFLTNQYLPRPGATGVCVHNLAKELVLRGEYVDVICYSDNSITDESVIAGVHIHRIPIPHCFDVSPTIIQSILSWFRKLLFIRKYPLRSGIVVKRYLRVLKHLVNNSERVVVISTYTPIEADYAVLKFIKKNPTVHSVFYSTDTLSNEEGKGILPVSFRQKKGREWESILFRSFDIVFIMECHECYYRKVFRDKFDSKIRIANFPLLVRPALDFSKSPSSQTIRLVYAGSVLMRLRNPYCACSVLTELSNKLPIRVDFYGAGDAVNVVKFFEHKTDGLIKHHGMQDHDRVEKELFEADVLLSIGNNNSPMMPSKIYEYMALGKPIVHFYSWDQDPCLVPLRIYKNSFLMKSDDKSHIEDLSLFLSNSYTIPFEEVEALFSSSTPSFTVEMIQSAFKAIS